MFRTEVPRGIAANHVEGPEGQEIPRGLKLHTKTTWDLSTSQSTTRG